MDFAFELGQAEGCRNCHLDVDGSTPAVQFYERLGMRVLVKTEVPLIQGVYTHYRMVKELQSQWSCAKPGAAADPAAVSGTLTRSGGRI
jgi:hypothetical protein